MFLYRKTPKKTEVEQLLEQLKENDYMMRIADLEAEISHLQLMLAVKDCKIAAMELREVTESWRN
ncbi:MAG: hypothetical protein NC091_05525 [Bacteroides sp.]|nr:hypothetical protein [Bacteroides sp.]